jgi:hypothetical protein
MDMATVAYMAPEQAEDAHGVDHRADIYSLGCTLYFLLTGREPFPGATVFQRMKAHRDQPAPSLRAVRPDVPALLEACYQQMMAKRADDRPRSMTEVIALLQAAKPLGNDIRERAAPRPRPSTTIELSRSSPAAALRAWSRKVGDTRLALAAVGLLLIVIVAVAVSRPSATIVNRRSPAPVAQPDSTPLAQPVPLPAPEQPDPEIKTIFDGSSPRGWMLCNRARLPPAHVQADGLNPHGTGSYLAVYQHKLGDFVLEFDYKLSQGCNSGVFLRVSDLNNPLKTGVEVALDDTRWGDDRDSGAFRGLVAPTSYVQKPSGQWNHMSITAQGSRLAVSLNDTEVSSIDLDLWVLPGKRPDGGDHGLGDITVADMARSGYVGFQDLGSDCWFKNIVLKTNTAGRPKAPLPRRQPGRQSS